MSQNIQFLKQMLIVASVFDLVGALKRIDQRSFANLAAYNMLHSTTYMSKKLLKRLKYLRIIEAFARSVYTPYVFLQIKFRTFFE